MTSGRTSRRAVARLLIVLGVLLGACGSDDRGAAPADVVLDCPAGVGVRPDGGRSTAPDGAGDSAGDVPIAAPDGAQPDTTEPPGPTPTEWLFDDTAAPRRIRIDMAPEDWRWLQDNATREEYVPAEVAVEGRGGVERFATAAVRFKGAFGSLHSCFTPDGTRTCSKLSLKVSFNRYDKKGRFFGLRKFILNSCNRDDSCLRERLSYAMYRAAGVEASRAVHVAVSVNDEPASFYLLVEEVDHEFLEDHFDDADGNLYKEVWPQYGAPDPYVAALETNEDEADVARLLALARLLGDGAPPSPEALDPWIDRDTMASYFVVDQLTNNWDGIWKFYCHGEYCGNHNFYLYEDPASGHVVVIPWDLDHCFERPNSDLARSWWEDGPTVCDVEPVNEWASIRAPQCDPLLRTLMRGDWDRYRARMAALVTAPGAPLSVERALLLLDRYRAQLWPLVDADPAGPGLARWRRAVAELRQIVLTQYHAAHAFLDEPSIASE